MIRHGVAPFLECSSLGDRRFSAFCARVNGKSIEEQYQSAKRFDGELFPHQNWRDRKGFRASNQTEVRALYTRLWNQYITEHSELLPVLKAASGVSDIFGQPGSVCQATELWRIRNAQ